MRGGAYGVWVREKPGAMNRAPTGHLRRDQRGQRGTSGGEGPLPAHHLCPIFQPMTHFAAARSYYYAGLRLGRPALVVRG